jgi:hypothetical protein
MTMHSDVPVEYVPRNGLVVNGNSAWPAWPNVIPWVEPWVQPQPWFQPTVTFTLGVVHHCSFPLKAGALSPCGMELVSAHGTTGQQSSSDLDAVTCLGCLRALAKATR